MLKAMRQQKMQSRAAKLKSVNLVSCFNKIILKERNRKDKE